MMHRYATDPYHDRWVIHRAWAAGKVSDATYATWLERYSPGTKLAIAALRERNRG